MARENDKSTKIEATVLEDARIVARFRKVHLAEYLSDALRTVVARDLAHEMAKKSKAVERKGGKEG